MLTPNVALVPAESSQKKEAITGCGPMSLQPAADPRGLEMHPQEFIRLVGCQGPNAGSHEDAQRVH
jgi:hypothetical protein